MPTKNAVIAARNIAGTGFPPVSVGRGDASFPAMRHAEDVVARCETDEERVVAWLHDFFWLYPDFDSDFLIQLNFPKFVIRPVVLLTRVSRGDLTISDFMQVADQMTANVQRYCLSAMVDEVSEVCQLPAERDNLLDTYRRSLDIIGGGYVSK